MAEQQLTRRGFEDLVPFYVNGTLGREDVERVEAYLTEHPEARAHLWWHQSLQQRIRENVPPVAADAGFERLLERIRAEAPAPRKIVAPSLGERLRGLVGSLGLTPRFAFAAVLVLVQAGVIGKLLLDNQSLEQAYTEVRSGTSRVGMSGTLIRVSFRPEAKESELRMLLVSIGGTVVEGPSQLGDYIVKVPTDTATQAAQQLTASEVVESAMVLGEARRR